MATRIAIADPIARRLRARRVELGLSLAQASARAGIKAPSFLHHIERGERIPSEEVVVWLAAALQEDDELLRAWVRLRRGAPLDLALAAAHLIERHLAENGGLNEAGSNGAQPEPNPGGAQAQANGGGNGAHARAEIPPLLLRVPRYEWGVDPVSSKDAPEPAEILRLDPRALPEEAWLRPFAYRLPSNIPLPVPLRAEDLVLVTRNAWPLQPKPLYLVRTSDGPRLSRVGWREGRLWLANERLGHAQPLEPSGTPPRDLLGRVGAVIHSGSPAEA